MPDSVAIAIIKAELPWLQSVTGDSLNTTGQMIRSYQEHYGLTPTGKQDTATVRRLRMAPDEVQSTIAANMERIRWLPRELETEYLMVNVPLMELFYRKDGYDVLNMRVVVGKPARQTPSLNANMANVVFSPSWGVPPTILKQDVIPGVEKRGATAYLDKKNLDAYDRKGRKVNPGSINSSNVRNYSYKQAPGDDNALGDIKFNLPNKWDIYLHDTPHREDFVKRYRAKSSGCIRVERPRELAEYILKEKEGKAFDLVVIDSLIQTRKTRFEQLKTRIPVHIVYLTAFEDNSKQHIRLIPDIYNRDSKLIAALSL
jgi:murein L,D-transpeptidase YcbB/YkuD